MRSNHVIVRSLWHYRRRNLVLALGMATGMAVITGALVTGDSVRTGLQNLVKVRLGNADLSVSSGDRYFTDSLAYRVGAKLGIPVSAVLQLEGPASAGGGSTRLPKVQVFGVEGTFGRILGAGTFETPVNEYDAIISDNLADRLGLKVGDEFLVRIKKPGPVPVDAPFVSDEGNIITARLTVKTIAGKEQHGRFHLQNTQSAPFNVFIAKGYLQKLAGLNGLSNLMVMAGNGRVDLVSAGNALASERTLADAGLHLEQHPGTGDWILRTPRIFLDAASLSAIESVPSDKTLWFSYFVNEFRAGNRTTPYSFVSTLPGGQVDPGCIIINQWLATDLQVKQGDSVSLSYFMVGPLRSLTVENRRFLVTGIIPMNDPRSDRLLMPEIPGLSDAGNCRDWETSIPIDLGKIRYLDEDYWNRYRGTPKAFINPDEAAAMWQNRFGKYTQVRFPASIGSAVIEKSILLHLSPSETGMQLRNPAGEGRVAASSGVDFSELFLGLSFFLIAGGLILTVLLIRLGLDGRMAQVGTLRALGIPGKRIRQMLLWETGLVAVFGALMGIALTYLYTILIFKALNGVWNDIVLTDTLRPVFKIRTLAAGTLISLEISSLTAWLVLTSYFKRKTLDLVRRNRQQNLGRGKVYLTGFSMATGLGALLMLGYGLIRFHSVGPAFFFTTATLLLISVILLTIRIFHHHSPAPNKIFDHATWVRSNLWRNSSRSLSVVLLFAIGIFMVVAIGANRKSTGPRESGTGGFLFYLETTVPVPDNLNNTQVRAKYGLETASGFVQMKKVEGDDASCLNLNRVTNPPLLGIPAGSLTGRFSFASLERRGILTDPWVILEEELPGHAIPAIADQTVIEWGLGLKTGDTIKYKSEIGDTVNIVLAGGLAGSIFQGSILISESQLMRHWPSVSGTRVMLVSADQAIQEKVRSEISGIFRDYGTDLKPAAERLAEFNAVENTYLSIFLVMGALAMLLGTIGLAIILARNLQERKSEIALLRATGFSMRRIFGLVVMEYSTLLILGILAGGVPALISVFPVIFNPASGVSVIYLVSILITLIANGFFWIMLLGWISVSKPGIIQSLREE